MAVAARRATPTGTSRARNLRSRAVAAQARRRRLQRLVHVPDPARWCSSEIGLSLPLFIKWDDSEFGLRAKAAGYPTVTFPGAAVWHVPWTDKNDARRLAGLLPPAQPLHRGAAALAVPAAAAGWCARASTTRSSTSSRMQYSTVELRHQALEDVLAGPDALHDAAADQAGRGQRVRASSSPTPSCTPTPTPSRRSGAHKPPRKGKDAGTEIPGRALAADHRRARADPPAAAGARAVAGAPRGRAHRDGRQVVPPRDATTRRSSR